MLLLTTSVCLVSSCKIPFDEVDLNVKLTPEYAVPLVETDMNVQDLLGGFNGNAFLQLQSDGSFKMSYLSQTIETQPFNLFSGLPEVQTIPITQQDVVIPFPAPANTNIDVIEFKKGYFKWRFDPQPTTVTVKITIPQFTKNGQPFMTSFALSNAAVSDSINLAGWICEPTMGNIVINYKATKLTGESVSLNNQGDYAITRFESKSMKGYFGEFILPIPKDSFVFDFFKTWRPNGKIQFTEPVVTVNFDNSLGFPTRLLTTKVEGTNQAGEKIALQSPFSSGVDIDYPNLSQIGTSKKTTTTINNKNSNIVSVMGSYPTTLSYSFIALTNTGNTSKASGFLNDDSKLKMSVNIDIPLIGTAENFTVLDTMVLDLSKFSQVTNAEFKITTDNGLPLDMALQGYFINSSGVVIDSLVQKEPLILRGAPTTTLGTTIGTSPAYNFVKMDAAKFTSIRSAKKIIVKYTVSSTNNGANPVQINRSQNFNLKLGVRVGVDL
jgi:hypothetical protein